MPYFDKDSPLWSNFVRGSRDELQQFHKRAARNITFSISEVQSRELKLDGAPWVEEHNKGRVDVVMYKICK